LFLTKEILFSSVIPGWRSEILKKHLAYSFFFPFLILYSINLISSVWIELILTDIYLLIFPS
jgi:hypothetical protein